MLRFACCLTALIAPFAAFSQGRAQLFTRQINHQGMSCVSALQTNGGKFDEDLRWWALGSFSGHNVGVMALVGWQTKSNGIIAEIEKTCRDQPSLPLPSAVNNTYVQMKKKGR